MKVIVTAWTAPSQLDDTIKHFQEVEQRNNVELTLNVSLKKEATAKKQAASKSRDLDDKGADVFGEAGSLFT